MFQNIITKVLANEGGYANVSGDTGGETYRGISRVHNPGWNGWATIDAFKAKNGGIAYNYIIPDNALENLVISFYKTNYWDKILLDKLKNESLQEIIFDAYVNSGTNGIKVLQRTLNTFGKGLVVDGVCGENTIAAVNACNAEKLFNAYKTARETYYRSIATGSNAKFLTGWLNRLATMDYKAVIFISTGVLILGVASFF